MSRVSLWVSLHFLHNFIFENIVIHEQQWVCLFNKIKSRFERTCCTLFYCYFIYYTLYCFWWMNDKNLFYFIVVHGLTSFIHRYSWDRLWNVDFSQILPISIWTKRRSNYLLNDLIKINDFIWTIFFGKYTIINTYMGYSWLCFSVKCSWFNGFRKTFHSNSWYTFIEKYTFTN